MTAKKVFYPIFHTLTEELIEDSLELLKDFNLPLEFVQDGANATMLTEHIILTIIGYSAKTVRGALTLLAPRKTAQCIDPGGIELSDDDELLADIFGEMANQMLGRFKNSLLPRGVTIQLTTPTTICGSHLRFPNTQSGLSSWLLFAKGQHKLYVRLDATFELDFELLEPNSKSSQASILDEGEMIFF